MNEWSFTALCNAQKVCMNVNVRLSGTGEWSGRVVAPSLNASLSAFYNKDFVDHLQNFKMTLIQGLIAICTTTALVLVIHVITGKSTFSFCLHWITAFQCIFHHVTFYIFVMVIEFISATS